MELEKNGFTFFDIIPSPLWTLESEKYIPKVLDSKMIKEHWSYQLQIPLHTVGIDTHSPLPYIEQDLGDTWDLIQTNL